MLIQSDAWNVRERDGRGRGRALRAQGKEPGRWRRVYTGACFRLDHRGRAAGALVIGDGAVWIWRLAGDRRPQARQRPDFYHAARHLAAAGRALFGEDKEKLKNRLKLRCAHEISGLEQKLEQHQVACYYAA